MVDSGFRWIAAAGETFDSVALSVYGYEQYAAELLNANPSLCGRLTFSGGEILVLPSISVPDESETIYTPAIAPWKE